MEDPIRTATLRRCPSTQEGTPGVLRAGDLVLATMELPWRENRRNVSAVPSGGYRVMPYCGPRFGLSLLVTGVPGRDAILIHAGNLGGDVALGFRTHTRGCILPGLRVGRLRIGNTEQRAVLSSRVALRQLLKWAADRPFRLEVLHD